jgi:hypothetical protein
MARRLDERKVLHVELEVSSPKAYGIDKAKWNGLLVSMAAQPLASGSPGNNSRVPSDEEIIAHYHQAWG